MSKFNLSMNNILSYIQVYKCENIIKNNSCESYWIAQQNLNPNDISICVSDYAYNYFKINKKYLVFKLFNRFIKFSDVLLMVSFILLSLVYYFYRFNLIAFSMLLISFVYLLFQTVKYYLNSKDTSTLIITNGTVLDVIMEKNTNSDFYFNSFLIEFYLEDGTKLIQKTINQYSFFDKHVKKINIEKGTKILIQYDKNIIEYVRWLDII